MEKKTCLKPPTRSFARYIMIIMTHCWQETRSTVTPKKHSMIVNPTSHPIVARKNVHPISQFQSTIIYQSNIPICCMVNGYDVMYARSMYASIQSRCFSPIKSLQSSSNNVFQLYPIFFSGKPVHGGPPSFVCCFMFTPSTSSIYTINSTMKLEL